MKKNILKIGLLLFVFAITFSCEKNENVNPNHQKKVRLARVLKYSKSSDSKPKEEIVYTYDKAGNLIKEEYFVIRYNPIKKTIYMYNKYEYSQGQKTKMEIFTGEEGNPTLGSYIEYYYKDNLLVKEVTKRGRGGYGTLIDAKIYEYDKKGNLIRKYMNDSEGEISGDVKYSYGNQNRLILTENSNTSTGVNFGDEKYTKCIYDNSGRKVKIEYTNINNELIKYTDIFYNKTSQQPEKELNFDKDGKQVRKYAHYYDNFGNLTETVINDECSIFKRKYKGRLLVEEILYMAHEYGYYGAGQMPETEMSKYEYKEYE